MLEIKKISVTALCLLAAGCSNGSSVPMGCTADEPAVLEFWIAAMPHDFESAGGEQRVTWRSVSDLQRWLEAAHPNDWRDLLENPDLLSNHGLVVREFDDGAVHLALLDEVESRMTRTDNGHWGVASSRIVAGSLGRPVPGFQLDDGGTQLLHKLTLQATVNGRSIAVLLNGTVVGVVDPVAPLSTGAASIPGRYTANEARCIARRLR